jgi:hypothetical protein
MTVFGGLAPNASTILGNSAPVAITGTTLTGGNTTAPGAGALGTSTPWHIVVLWFGGIVAMLALASVAPNIATLIVVLLIVAQLLTHWNDTYKGYLGIQ